MTIRNRRVRKIVISRTTYNLLTLYKLGFSKSEGTAIARRILAGVE